jgi:branched-chain amino acid transport system substrate-binding protein
MKLKSLALTAALVASTLGALLAPSLAQAQAKEQFFPLLVYRTGPYAPNGTPWANGKQDYLKLVNAQGGINGVKITFEECETGYATDKGVECYERLKGRPGVALFDPQATGITFALTDKVPTDKIPLVTLGYGLAASQDGGVFKWNFPLMGSYWTAADILIQHLGKKEGGLDKLKGKKIALVYHDSPFGKEPIPLLQERAKHERLRALADSGDRTRRGTEIGLAAGAPVEARLRAAVGLGRDELHRPERSRGHGLPAREDVRRVVGRRRTRREGRGRQRQGLQRARVQHLGSPSNKVIQDILKQVHDKGQGSGPKRRSRLGALHARRDHLRC